MPPVSVAAEPKEKRKKKTRNVFRIWLEFIPFWLFYILIRALPLNAASGLSRLLFKLIFTIDKGTGLAPSVIFCMLELLQGSRRRRISRGGCMTIFPSCWWRSSK